MAGASKGKQGDSRPSGAKGARGDDDTAGDVEHDPRVSTIPLDTEDGGTVVIAQQVVGADNEVGGGEFPEGELEKPVEKAAAEQERLEREAPTS